MYTGFSTIDNNKKWKLADTELIKRDLLNHFNTRRGERLHLPEFGSKLWEMSFDPLTPELREEIIAEATRIVASEPRVQLRSIDITEYEHGFQIAMDLYYVNIDFSEQMYLQFNTQTNELFSI